MCLIQPSTTLTSSPFLLSPISQPSRVHCGHGEENPSHDASLQKYYKVIFCSVVDRSVGQCLAFFMFTMFAITLALRDTVFWDSMSLFVALCGQSMGTCRCNAIASLALWGGGSTASSHTKKKERELTNLTDIRYWRGKRISCISVGMRSDTCVTQAALPTMWRRITTTPWTKVDRRLPLKSVHLHSHCRKNKGGAD